MAIGLLGRKVGMTQIFDETGTVIPVTVIQAGPCHVLQLRTAERDGYEAVQLGFADMPRRIASRSQRGHVAKLDSKRARRRGAGGVDLPDRAGCEPKRFVRELRGAVGEHTIGQQLSVAVFESVPSVDVTGTSKGRGTAGPMKRHNFAGLPASHGVKKHHRAPGSVGSHASNRGSGRPKRGKRMAGRYGAERVTIRNLRIVRIDADNNLVLVEGAVPGPNGGLISIRPTNKKKR